MFKHSYKAIMRTVPSIWYTIQLLVTLACIKSVGYWTDKSKSFSKLSEHTMQHSSSITPILTFSELQLSAGVTNNWVVYWIEGTAVVKKVTWTYQHPTIILVRWDNFSAGRYRLQISAQPKKGLVNCLYITCSTATIVAALIKLQYSS